MNKRHALLLTAVLGMATAYAQIPTSTAPASTQSTASMTDSALSTARVSIEVGNYSGPLSSLLAAIAKSAGYGIILETDVDAQSGTLANAAANASAASGTARPIIYSFRDTPFNEVWPLIMDVAGLSYEVVQVGGRPVLRVSNRPVQTTVKLEYVDANYAYEKLVQFFGNNTFKVVADSAGGSLIIGGTSSAVNSARNFIRSIDVKSNAGTATPQTAMAQRIYTVRTQASDIQSLIAAQFPNLRVTPVGQTKQLVLNGTQRDLEAAMALIEQVDRLSDSDAAAAASPNVQQVYSVRGDQAAMVTFLGAQFPSLKIVPVGQTSQLLLNGSKAQIDAALALLGQVDVAPRQGDQVVQRVFQLVNASAEELKATLENTLARNAVTTASRSTTPVTGVDANGNPVTVSVPSTAGATTTSTTATTADATDAATPSAPKVTIIADRRTNTLVVRGTQLQIDQAAELIPQLDRKVPQINVQVRIQEISEEAGRTLGLNWRANFGQFSVTAGSGGLGALFNPTQTFAGFNIFPTLTAMENQGLTKTIYDGTVTMQSGQRELGVMAETQNASAGAAATIKSGGKLELNLTGPSGNIQKTIDYGTIIDFFNPQVAPDGSITLRVRGQVSNLDTADVTANLLRFTNKEAQSTITFKDGETVLMSGLMGTRETSTKTGLPFLTSTPLNALAGKTVTNKTATQLLVVITGTIVK